jgi:hypothetical protein
MSRHVTVFRTTDPLEADMVRDLLADDGIAARRLGTRDGAAIGVGQHILAQRIEVPAELAARARELIEVYQDVPAADEPAADVDEPVLESVSSHRRLRRTLAAGLVWVLPGGGHFYVRRPWTGLCIVIGWAVAIFGFAFGDASDMASGFLGVSIPTLLLLDLVGAQVAVGSFNAGHRPTVSTQFAIGVVLLAAAAVAGVLIGMMSGG